MYRILKDIFRILFKKRILKIAIIILLFFIILNIKQKCFAITPAPIVVDGVTYTFTDNTWVGNYDVDKLTIIKYNDTYRAIYSKYPLYFTTSPTRVYSYDNNNNETLLQYTQSARVSGNTVTFWSSPSTNYAFNSNITSFTGFSVIYSETDIYFNGDMVYSQFVSPTLSNTQTQLENLNFSNFIINTNSFTEDMIANPDEPLVMLFYNRSLSNSSNTDGLYPIKEKYFYKESIYFDTANSTNTNYIFNYPIFKTGVFFNIGSTYEIKFAKRVYLPEFDTWGYDYFDTNYTFTVSSNVTQDYINQLNQQTAISTDEDNHNELNNSINNQTQAIENQTQSIDNINNSITNSTVDSSSIDLPTDNTNDPTQSGADNIFQTIYNTFTSGNAQNVVFPIPFTNKSITLQPDYIYNALDNNGASWIITIIQAFYWYIISRFIIVDIMKKIRKIKQGDFENIQNSNIKEDML